MKVSNFITKLVRQKTATTQIGAIQDPEIYNFIHFAQQEVAAMYKWKFLRKTTDISIVSGEADLSANFRKQIKLTDSSGTKVDEMELEDYFEATSGWTIDEISKKLFCKTDGTYKLLFFWIPDETVDENTEVLGLTHPKFFPLLEGIGDLVVSRCMAHVKRHDESIFWKNEGIARVKKFWANNRYLIDNEPAS